MYRSWYAGRVSLFSYGNQKTLAYQTLTGKTHYNFCLVVTGYIAIWIMSMIEKAEMGSFTICNSSRDRKLFLFILIPFGHKCSAQNKRIQMETRCLDETIGWFQFCVYELHTRRFLSLSTVSCGVFKYIKCIHWRQRRRIMIPYRVEKDWCNKYVQKTVKRVFSEDYSSLLK